MVIASRKAANVEPAAAHLDEECAGRVLPVVLDIRDRERVTEVCKGLVEEHGRIDILVNNGGGQFLAPAEAITPNGFDAVVGTNLTGTWNVTRGVADAWMLRNGGRIVNISSGTPFRGVPFLLHYVTSKGAIVAFTRSLAKELGADGIFVNCVAPGFTISDGVKAVSYTHLTLPTILRV